MLTGWGKELVDPDKKTTDGLVITSLPTDGLILDKPHSMHQPGHSQMLKSSTISSLEQLMMVCL